ADPRRLHQSLAGLAQYPVHRERCLLAAHQQPAAGIGVRGRPDRGDGRLPRDRPAPGSVRAPVRLSPATRNLLRGGVFITLAFIYIPLIVIAIYAFNGGNTLEWPPPHLTTHWFGQAIDNSGARDAFVTSLKVGVVATGIALLLGSLASFAVARFRFFGRETISFLVVLPIALPGVVTGVPLSHTFTPVLH